MDKLELLRKEIDDIDGQLVELFEKRMETVLKVGEYKTKMNLPILNESREEEVITKNIDYLRDRSLENYLKDFLLNLMEISKRLQKRK